MVLLELADGAGEDIRGDAHLNRDIPVAVQELAVRKVGAVACDSRRRYASDRLSGAGVHRHRPMRSGRMARSMAVSSG
jgi:hypothetical protein